MCVLFFEGQKNTLVFRKVVNIIVSRPEHQTVTSQTLNDETRTRSNNI